MNSKLGNILMLLGGGGFVAATVWWISFFYEILALFSDIPAYDPRLLWLGAAMFVLGMLLRIFSGHRH